MLTCLKWMRAGRAYGTLTVKYWCWPAWNGWGRSGHMALLSFHKGEQEMPGLNVLNTCNIVRLLSCGIHIFVPNPKNVTSLNKWVETEIKLRFWFKETLFVFVTREIGFTFQGTSWERRLVGKNSLSITLHRISIHLSNSTAHWKGQELYEDHWVLHRE